MPTITEKENTVLSVRGLKKSFGGQAILDDISVDLKQGEVVLLRGENGSGKTTLVNILTGNLEPDKGEIHLNFNGNKELFSWPRHWWKALNPFDHFTPERLVWEGVGRVWQDIRLFPTMSTLENVMVFAPGLRGENPVLALISNCAKKENRQNKKISSEWLGKLGLGDRLDSSCDKIPLGQMKRVAIARARPQKPWILLFPSSSFGMCLHRKLQLLFSIRSGNG
ncbi:MAG: bceA 2 [Candidatus Brocadiaceae bacterium]|nr:bceA 2 [Candidatus Brocadiaceae bacterium]